MRILLNGEPTTLDAGATIETVVASLGHDPSLPGVAVAVDGDVVRRRDWAATPVEDDAVIEVLTAVQGGAR